MTTPSDPNVQSIYCIIYGRWSTRRQHVCNSDSTYQFFSSFFAVLKNKISKLPNLAKFRSFTKKKKIIKFYNKKFFMYINHNSKFIFSCEVANKIFPGIPMVGISKYALSSDICPKFGLF